MDFRSSCSRNSIYEPLPQNQKRNPLVPYTLKYRSPHNQSSARIQTQRWVHKIYKTEVLPLRLSQILRIQKLARSSPRASILTST